MEIEDEGRGQNAAWRDVVAAVLLPGCDITLTASTLKSRRTYLDIPYHSIYHTYTYII